MDSIIIGIDPDSEKHGVSIWRNGKLSSLQNMNLIELYEFALDTKDTFDIAVHMENVRGCNATFTKKHVYNNKANTMVSLSIGRCQQAQAELERVFEHLGVKVVLHKVSKCWKDSKTGCAALKDLGWTGRSNEDTRSAAYFGYLGVKKVI